MANNTFNIPKIPIVGGPCSGKSTGLVHINEKLTSLGFTPLFVPESATILFNSGLSQSRVGSNYLFQSMLFDYQIQNEIYFDKQASLLGHSGKKSIIILDRSLIDGKAYCTPQIWQQILDERNIKESELYNRYNALIHLDTAPREFYTTENNIRRKDSYEEACALTEQTKQVYVGASHLSMITNRGNFKTKMFDIVSELLRIIGYPKPIEIKKKYVLTGNFTLNDFPDDVPFFVSNIQQYYVLSEDKNLITHVRKRSFNNGMTLYVCNEKNTQTKVEREEYISKLRYDLLIQNSDLSKQMIDKVRYCFLWENQYFELDFFNSPSDHLPILELELTTLQSNVYIPPWIGSLKDITNEPQ